MTLRKLDKILLGILLFDLVLIVASFFVAPHCKAQGNTFLERETWVSRYLANGGNIRNVTGLVQPANWKQEASFDAAPALADLPAKFNWNDYYRLQPIKNQASCGSCWAFAITAVVEALYWIENEHNNNDWYDLAEQRMVSSCTQGSCQGGYFTAFNYVRDNGLPHESADPYLARNSACKEGVTPLQKAIEWKYIGGENTRPTTEQLKTAIYLYGPIAVDVNGSFSSYSSGVYNRCGSTGTNHMVNLEGWVDDDTYSANGGGYWIMRNSWGTGWGEDGYMKIVYKSTGGSNCNGIGNVGAYAIIPGLEPHSKMKAKFSVSN